MGNDIDTSNVISTNLLRLILGLGSMFLPIILMIGVWLPLQKNDLLQPSMSEFVYTGAGPAFYGALFSLGIMFVAYVGYPGVVRTTLLTDRKLSLIAALGAFMTAAFPVPSCVVVDGTRIGVSVLDLTYVAWLHYLGALILFSAMAVFCLFHFTLLGTKGLTPNKEMRNKIHRRCGYVILAGISLLIVRFIITRFVVDDFMPACSGLGIVFYVEAIMTFAFGFAWLVKSKFILRD